MSLPREIHGHEVEGEDVRVRVLAMDTPLDGASHQYRFEREDGGQVGYLNFHLGEIEENVNDVNGTTHAAVIVVLIDMLKGLQTGAGAHKQNDFAIKRLEEALRAAQVKIKESIEKKAAELSSV